MGGCPLWLVILTHRSELTTPAKVSCAVCVPHTEDNVFGRAISDEVYSISLSLTKTQKPFVLYELMLLEVNCIHASYK